MKHNALYAGILGAFVVMATSTAALATPTITLDPLPGTHDITSDLSIIDGGNAATVNISGAIPKNSTLTFTLTLPDDGIFGQDSALSYISTGINPINAQATSGITNFDSTTSPLAFVSANLQLPSSEVTTITNSDSISHQYGTSFLAFFEGGVPTLTYTLSSVPLPPALAMFGTVLAGLFGFSAMRRKNAFVAA